MLGRVLDEGRQKELGGSFDYLVMVSQFGPVAGVEEMFPHVGAEPRAPHWPKPPGSAIDGGGSTPAIGVVVGDPTLGLVVNLGSSRTGFRDLGDHVEQGLVAFGKVGLLGGPVVHFRVDVDRVFRAPRWGLTVIPEALKSGWLPTRSGAGNEQVPAILEVEGGKRRVGPGRKVQNSLIRRGLRGSASEIDRDSMKEALMVLYVLTMNLGKALVSDNLQGVVRGREWVSGDVFVALVAGGHRDQDRHGIGVGYEDRVLASGHRSPFGLDFSETDKANGAGDAIEIRSDSFELQQVAFGRTGRLLRAREMDFE